jgi:hypothetical protein
VVHLLQERSPTADDAVVHREPIEERELPQRAGPVERALRQLLAHVEQRAHVVRRRYRDATYVVVEIEAGVVGELGRGDAERRRDDPLPQARDRGERGRGVVHRFSSARDRGS